MINVKNLCAKTKIASLKFVSATTDKKNQVLSSIAKKIADNVDIILEKNKIDLANGKKDGLTTAFLDRLALNEQRIDTMCQGIEAVIALPDYVGLVDKSYTLPNNLLVEKVHSPLGVVGIIYESRPNVTVDAAILCIKSGNGAVLKGGKEAINSNRILVSLMQEALQECDIDSSLVTFIDGIERQLTTEMLSADEYIDVVIPRGGENLKKFVLKTATMPVIASSGGNCHIFVEKSANLDMALRIVENAKMSRPSTCNAVETLLIDSKIADKFAPMVIDMLLSNGVELRGKEQLKKYYKDIKIIDQSEFYTEYSDLIIKIDIVDDINKAIEHINIYNTKHSDAIITSDDAAAKQFAQNVDAGAVYVNASTRFTDGFELGLGAEMGISTQKLHVRGPIGLKELTSLKYVVKGSGQVR